MPFLEKVDDLFLVVALSTHTKTTTSPLLPSNPAPSSKKFIKNWLLPPPWGALTNYARKKFFSPWGLYLHPLHPLTTPT